MMLAQHFGQRQLFEKAMDYINKAIEHTPTLIELYLIKGKLYKAQNLFDQAFEMVDYGRSLDLADRFLNNQAIKYALYKNDTQKAEELIDLFMKHESDTTIYDLQTTWFEYRMAQAHKRNKNYGASLRQFKYLLKQYEDIKDDQFDFHMYCFRKYTLRQYLELLAFEDKLIS